MSQTHVNPNQKIFFPGIRLLLLGVLKKLLMGPILVILIAIRLLLTFLTGAYQQKLKKAR